MSLPPFEQVVADHAEVVWRVCRAVVGLHDAEDAWSETFAAALRAYPKLRPGSNLRGWLVTIAHHKAIDTLRAAGRAGVPVDPPRERAVTDAEPGEVDPALWAAVAGLAPKQRQAVAYHYLADLPYVEVARLVGGSEAAARRAAADGIASLRGLLSEEERP